jgi:hypothetical protein
MITERRWCRIHRGGRLHLHAKVCGACLTPFDTSGNRTCEKTCAGQGYRRWDPPDQQDSWRCIE